MFTKFTKFPRRFDMERFEVQYEDLKWMAGKAEQRKSKTDKQSETDRVRIQFDVKAARLCPHIKSKLYFLIYWKFWTCSAEAL